MLSKINSNIVGMSTLRTILLIVVSFILSACSDSAKISANAATTIPLLTKQVYGSIAKEAYDKYDVEADCFSTPDFDGDLQKAKAQMISQAGTCGAFEGNMAYYLNACPDDLTSIIGLSSNRNQAVDIESCIKRISDLQSCTRHVNEGFSLPTECLNNFTGTEFIYPFLINPSNNYAFYRRVAAVATFLKKATEE